MGFFIRITYLWFVMVVHVTITTSQENTSTKPAKNTTTYNVTSDIARISSRLDDVRVIAFLNSAYHERVTGRLNVEIQNVTTSSIDVAWSLSERKFSDSVLESSVICETSKGFMVSRKHITEASYKLHPLQANTTYIVCVYMLEKSKSRNLTVLHFNCHSSTTTPIIYMPALRTDSVVAVLLTFGYIAVMVSIGYATWRWKRKKLLEDMEGREKLAIEEEYDDEELLNGNHMKGGCGVVGGAASGPYIEDFDGSSRKESSSLRGSSRLLSNSIGRGSRSNDIHSVTFAESDVVVLEKKGWGQGSVDEVNGGCLDMKRSSRGSASAVKLSDLSEPASKQQNRKYQKSQSMEDGLVKVTEITF